MVYASVLFVWLHDCWLDFSVSAQSAPVLLLHLHHYSANGDELEYTARQALDYDGLTIRTLKNKTRDGLPTTDRGVPVNNKQGDF